MNPAHIQNAGGNETAEKVKDESNMVRCGVFYKACSVCGAVFAAGSEVCINGHQIGKMYKKQS